MSVRLAWQIVVVCCIAAVLIAATVRIERSSDRYKDSMVGLFLDALAIGPMVVIGSLFTYAVYVCATGGAS